MVSKKLETTRQNEHAHTVKPLVAAICSTLEPSNALLFAFAPSSSTSRVNVLTCPGGGDGFMFLLCLLGLVVLVCALYVVCGLCVVCVWFVWFV